MNSIVDNDENVNTFNAEDFIGKLKTAGLTCTVLIWNIQAAIEKANKHYFNKTEKKVLRLLFDEVCEQKSFSIQWKPGEAVKKIGIQTNALRKILLRFEEIGILDERKVWRPSGVTTRVQLQVNDSIGKIEKFHISHQHQHIWAIQGKSCPDCKGPVGWGFSSPETLRVVCKKCPFVFSEEASDEIRQDWLRTKFIGEPVMHCPFSKIQEKGNKRTSAKRAENKEEAPKLEVVKTENGFSDVIGPKESWFFHSSLLEKLPPITKMYQYPMKEVDQLARRIAPLLGFGVEKNMLQMTGTSSGKYTTPSNRKLELGHIKDHLIGYRTYGGSLRDENGFSHFLLIDADNEELWKLLCRCAQVLMELGIKMFLQRSPAKDGHAGGGHGYIVFDRPVPADRTFAYLCSLAPDLKSFKEVFPHSGTRIRFPAGFYRSKMVQSFCPTYFADGTHVGCDGMEVYPVIEANQVEASRVEAFEGDITEFRWLAPVKHREHDQTNLERNILPDDYYYDHYDKNAHFVLALMPGSYQKYLECKGGYEAIFGKINSDGFYLSPVRSEETPSIHVKNGLWCDFGDFLSDEEREEKAKARKISFEETPIHSGGDLLDAYCYVNGLTRSQAMHVLGKEIARRAKDTVILASINGEELPAWMGKVGTLTNYGLSLYNKNTKYQRKVA